MKHLLYSLLSLVIAVSACLISQPPAGAAFQKVLPNFEPAACMFQLPAGAVEGIDVQCGYLTVLEQHAVPAGPTIKLAVAIVPSKNPNPLPEPLVIAQGGPGGSTIDTYASLLIRKNSLSPNQDIVLFDQRGTLHSIPNLYCKEYDQYILDTIEKDLSHSESLKLELDAIAACRARLTAEGVNLAAYNSLENAADIEDLRQALDYPKIDLYGVSYGSLLALHFMEAFPGSLRSVILDGVVPPQTNFLLEAPRSEDRAFSELFKTCSQDAVCNSAYPNLEQVFFSIVDRLTQHSAIVPLTDPQDHKTYRSPFNGEAFQGGIFQMMYVSDLIPTIPRLIDQANQGEFTVFGKLMSLFVFDRTVSYGMYYSVLCSEDADFKPEDFNLNGIRPQIAKAEADSPSELLSTCSIWNVKDLGPQLDQPVKSDTPALLLSGAFDPITPPSFAQLVAANLSHSYSVTFPNGAHGAALSGTCPNQIIQEFLANPASPPDTSCLKTIPPIEFYSSANTIDLPVIMKLIDLESSALIEFAVLALSLCFLLTLWIVFPLSWLSRKIRSKPQTADSVPPTGLVRIGNLLAAMNSLVTMVFLVVLGYRLIQLVLQNSSRLFFGLPASNRPLFFLPVLCALLSAGMFLVSLKAWRRSNWSFSRRLYYSLLVLSSLAATGVFCLWGFLSAWI